VEQATEVIPMEQLEQTLREAQEKRRGLDLIMYSGMDRHTAKVKRIAIFFQERIIMLLSATIAIRRSLSLEFPDVTFMRINQQTYKDEPGADDCVIGSAEALREHDAAVVRQLTVQMNEQLRLATELQAEADRIATRARECLRGDRDFDSY